MYFTMRKFKKNLKQNRKIRINELAKSICSCCEARNGGCFYNSKPCHDVLEDAQRLVDLGYIHIKHIRRTQKLESRDEIYKYLKKGYLDGLSVILTKLDDLIKAGGGCATITKEDVDALEEEFLDPTLTWEDVKIL